MASVKIDVEMLEQSISALQMYYATGFTEDLFSDLDTSGAGKAEEGLADYNAECNLLLGELSDLYRNVEAFLTCIKEGTLNADAYGAKSIEAAAGKQKCGD